MESPNDMDSKPPTAVVVDATATNSDDVSPRGDEANKKEVDDNQTEIEPVTKKPKEGKNKDRREDKNVSGMEEPTTTVGSLNDEFRDVPDKPIWLKIATMLDEDERERIFPNIPELKGIERLAEATVESNRVKEYIKNQCMASERYEGRTFYYERNNMEKLFPGTIYKLLKELNDRSKANGPEQFVPRTLHVITEKDTPELVAIKTEINEALAKFNRETAETVQKNYEFTMENYERLLPERFIEAMKGKDPTLYDTKDPIRHLQYKSETEKDETEELWFTWGADVARFDSQEAFIEFCGLAGISDPSNPVVESYAFDLQGLHGPFRAFTWISDDCKVLIKTFTNPYESDGNCYLFGCTGLRSRGKFLFEWFKKNGKCGGYVSNGRNFI